LREPPADLAQVVSFIFLWRKKKMAPLSIQIYVVGPVQTNCYFAINDDTKEVLIIDPGASAKQLAEKVFLTPGHTVGGCCYYFPYQNTLFSGDSLFQTSIGRTDFPKGSASQLIHAIREKLMPLPDETAVYTGHGDMTTIGTERMYNPYL